MEDAGVNAKNQLIGVFLDMINFSTWYCEYDKACKISEYSDI